MATQEFYIYYEANPATQQLVKILIRTECEICNAKLEVKTGTYSLASYLDTGCKHYYSYEDVWNRRVFVDTIDFVELDIDAKEEYGVSCTDCNEFYPHAEKPKNDVKFKCWNCRTYPFYK